jgi:hypothetical protein
LINVKFTTPGAIVMIPPAEEIIATAGLLLIQVPCVCGTVLNVSLFLPSLTEVVGRPIIMGVAFTKRFSVVLEVVHPDPEDAKENETTPADLPVTNPSFDTVAI